MLLTKYLDHPLVKDREARKYCEPGDFFIKEKEHIISTANLNPKSNCLDISTGVGLLPYMLKQKGHMCDATDISVDMLDVDRYKESYTGGLKNFEAYEFLRGELGVSVTQYLELVPGETITLPKKYDCIFSTRIVWIDQYSESQYIDLLDNLHQYTDKIVFKFNFDNKDWASINDYKTDNQCEDGTLVCY